MRGRLQRRAPGDFRIAYRSVQGPAGEWFVSAELQLQPGDAFLFGPETRGLPDGLRRRRMETDAGRERPVARRPEQVTGHPGLGLHLKPQPLDLLLERPLPVVDQVSQFGIMRDVARVAHGQRALQPVLDEPA